MDSDELNFTEICRCCKRMESRMTSIFDGNAHHTYPPVKEMLRSIASLNVQENDGLPSLVCTSCLISLQDAYTFVLQLIQIDEELWQLLAGREKQADALSQVYDANQYITESLKKENESAPRSAPSQTAGAKLLEILRASNEPVQNVYQHGSTDNNYKNIDLVVKLEQDLDENINEPEVENEEISNLGNPLYLAPDAKKESTSHVDLLWVPKSEVMEDFEDVAEMGVRVNVDYQVEMEYGNSIHSLEAAEDFHEADAKEMLCPKSRRKRRKTTSVYNCKLCAHSSERMYNLKQHLLHAHCKEKPFACSKCNRSFVRRDQMLRHWQKCNGKFLCDTCNYSFLAEEALRQHRATVHAADERKESSQVKLTLLELYDPEKMEKYFTVTKSDVQNNDDNGGIKMERAENSVVNVKKKIEEICIKLEAERPQTTLKNTVFKCKLCEYSSTRMFNLKQHLLHAHCNDKPHACAKCSRKFARRDQMLRHEQKCTGEDKIICDMCNRLNFVTEQQLQIHKQRIHKGKSSISLSLEDMKDPVKMEKYYTVHCN